MTVHFNKGPAIRTSLDLFTACHTAEAQKYSNELKQNRLATLDNQQCIGTIDATSCIGVSYHTPEGSIIVHHHDDRSFHSLLPFLSEPSFKSGTPVKATLIGGCRNPDNRGQFPSDFSFLESHTLKNIDTIINFWNHYQLNIDLQGWALGDALVNETLCSDFIASKDGRVQLMKPGISNHLVPEATHRKIIHMATDDYLPVYNAAKGHFFELSDQTHILPRLKPLIQKILSYSNDQQLLNELSTTPTLEPPHFAASYRTLVKFVAENGSFAPKKVPAPQGPVIILQGEAGKVQ
jgi:hypothetical protein